MISAARLMALAVLAVPVFTGWFPFPVPIEIVPGVSGEPFLAVLAVLAGVALLCGPALLANTLAVTALIIVPIVFVGGTVSWLLAMAGGAAPGRAGSLHGPHYVGLALNMLGVIPLALAMVASVPIDRLEQRLLRREKGISVGEKYLLMFTRVFHHTVYFVIPNILEVIREEALLGAAFKNATALNHATRFRTWGARLTAGLVQVAVSGICASLRFVPLWAREIDDLPRRRRASKTHRSRM